MPLIGSGLIQSADTWPKASDWLIRDEFTDIVAAGSVNGTAATPGPGTRAVVDASSFISVASGSLTYDSNAAGTTTDNGNVALATVMAAPGQAVIIRGKNNDDIGRVGIGYFTTSWGNYFYVLPGNGPGTGRRLITASLSAENLTPAHTPGAYSDYVLFGTDAHAGLVVRDDGATWKLLYVVPLTFSSGRYVGVRGIGTGAWDSNIDYIRCIALPAPFNTDTGLATDTHSGAVSAGATFTHEADALIETTITTVPSADNIDIVFRQQDASNYWICRIATGGDISLHEVVSGTPTQRGVAAGVVSNGHRVVVIAEGSTIKGYSNNTLRWTYSSATNFATATAGEVDALGTGGAVSDLYTWPRTLSGTAASILNKVSA